ncbi:transcription-repair coupling factor [Candidatus Desantisbacteria bacterium]|nr:transcription-repair coupling factor [Candidatus Desantisbacteria bacterium]
MTLSSLLPLLKNLNNYHRIEKALSSGAGVSISGLSGSSKAYLLAGFLERLDKSVLIINPRIHEAEQLYEDIKTFYPTIEAQRHVGAGSKPALKAQSKKEGTESGGKNTALLAVEYFPSLEILPYEENPPSDELIGQRFAILERLSKGERLTLVTSLSAILYRISSPKDILTIKVSIDETLFRDTLLEDLVMIGYNRVNMTCERGDFSCRGGIVDVFPISAEYPVRIELFGDTIESIRQFDPDTQRSIGFLNEIEIFPRQEVAEKTSSIFDYLPDDCLVIIDDRTTIEQEFMRLREETESLYQEACKGQQFIRADTQVCPYPDQIMLKLEDILQQQRILYLGAADTDKNVCATFPSPNFGGKLEPLMQKLREYIGNGYTIILSVNYQGQAQRLCELLKEHGIAAEASSVVDEASSLRKVDEASPLRKVPEAFSLQSEELFDNALKPKIISGIFIVVSSIICGFDFPELRLLIMSDKEIFGKPGILHRRKFSQTTRNAPIENFTELNQGDFVVHIHYGIGQYLGLATTTVEGKIRDFLLIEYAQGDRLYVPVDQLGLIHKYIGSKDSHPQICRLHDKGWERTKEKVKKALESMSKELVEIYAARKALHGHVFSGDTTWQYEFESGFVYEETPDQIRAIEEIKKDMESPVPMDRLVCGDVGYGKTEVAIRAAFKAVMDGKQVAVLVPTTILAFQHYSTFTERFIGFPVNIRMLSRFKQPKEQKEIVSEIVNGKVDIVIGTHRLLQKDVSFVNMGLVIIDEEHKFGVKHKERMKSYRKLVDVLTLTATPIPRTLHFSLCGIRDISIIHTPPQGRLPIKTIVTPFSPEIIREAVLREMDRGGQVFFVHNQVKSIPWILDELNKIVPEARVIVAHGQMDECELERVILDFMEKRFDILLASAIIESGLDMPNVNTIIINNANRFGLAQLYQLRGRVGRAQHRAYAYLLHQAGVRSGERTLLSSDAQDRLNTMIEFSALGSGFNLAMRDLENRGAGNLLGAEQHGNVVAIGFEMYCHMLEEGMRKLKGTPMKKEVYTKITLPYESYIPEEYIQSSQERFRIYKRLASAHGIEEIHEIREEMLDRFGKYPNPVKRLLSMMNIRMLASNAQISSISFEDVKAHQQNTECIMKNTESPAFRKASGVICESPRVSKGNVYLDLTGRSAFAPKIVEIISLFPDRVRLTASHDRLVLKWEDEEKGMALLEQVLSKLAVFKT